jgi:hypothetical protein
LEKEERATSDEAFTGCILVVKWKDNKVVSVAFNKLCADPAKKAKSWNQVARKHINVYLPLSI